MAVEVREPADQRLAVERLELVQLPAVDDPADRLAHLVRLARIGRHDVQQRVGIEQRIDRRPHLPRRDGPRRPDALRRDRPRGPPTAWERADDPADQLQRVRVVLRQVIGHARRPRVQVTTAEVLGRHDLAGGGLHQRRTAEEDRSLVLDDDRLVAHRRHVRAAGRARAHHRRDLRDPRPRQVGLVEEDPPEVLLVGEDLVLARQERPAGIDQVDARQPVLLRHLLRAQVLLDRQRVVRTALHRRVVGDDHHLAPVDPTDPRDHARRR